MLKYPSKRKVARLNRRQRKKFKLGEFRCLTKQFKIIFRDGLGSSEVEAFSNRYWSFVNSIGLDTSGFDWNVSSWRSNEQRNWLIGWTGNLGRLTKTSSCTDEQLQKVLSWLKEQDEVIHVKKHWIDDSNYCVLTFSDEIRREMIPSFDAESNAGKTAYKWQITWFREVNKCETSCDKCSDRICS